MAPARIWIVAPFVSTTDTGVCAALPRLAVYTMSAPSTAMLVAVRLTVVASASSWTSVDTGAPAVKAS